MKKKLGIYPIAGTGNLERKLDLVFIHGLGGDAFSTWQYENKEEYFWPKELAGDFPEIGVWTTSYDGVVSKWGEDMPLEHQVENLLNHFVVNGIGNRPFALIAHSIGGLIAKYILTHAENSPDPDYRQISINCRGVVFLAVPDTGADWSNLFSYASVLFGKSKLIIKFSKNSSEIRRVDRHFNQLSKRNEFVNHAFVETKEVRYRPKIISFLSSPISKGIKIVSEFSAGATDLKRPPIPMNDDHISICKLTSKEDLLYRYMQKIIKGYLETSMSVTNHLLTDNEQGLPPSVLDNEGQLVLGKPKSLNTFWREAVLPNSFPPAWADGWGEDEYGLYADLTFMDVTQRFRWIAAGDFMMGSPENELERLSSEQQHSVILTQGYWLADTAVTQALWGRVVGMNPSKFKEDPNNPVEMVSWYDSQKFINSINLEFNGLFDGLVLRLPTEAEWEHACRAGTVTPFFYGDDITSEQVNFGNSTLEHKGKVEYVNTTVGVKSLPPNTWGLYEMHGNVWEWCEDAWQSELGGESLALVDPYHSGDSDSHRVVRGGSWSVNRGDVRSAYRPPNSSNDCSHYVGLRLSLGQDLGVY